MMRLIILIVLLFTLCSLRAQKIEGRLCNLDLPGLWDDHRDTVKGYVNYLTYTKKGKTPVYTSRPAKAIYLLEYGQIPCPQTSNEYVTTQICYGTIRTLEKIMIGKKEFDRSKYYEFIPADKVTK